MKHTLLVLAAAALVFSTPSSGALEAQQPAQSSCGKPTSAECWRQSPTGPLWHAATDGTHIGADAERLILVERCAIGGNLNSADCLALKSGGGAQTPARLESALSAPVTYRRPVLKWDIAAPSLEEVNRYGWYLHVDGVRQDLLNVRCGNATGQTPAGLFSCEIEVPDVAPGVHSLAVQAWIAASAPVTSTSLRVVIQ